MKKISLDSQPTALHLFLTLTKKSYLKSGFKKIEIENKKTWKCIITKVMGGCLFVLFSGVHYCCIFQKSSHAYVHVLSDIKNSQNIMLNAFPHRIVTRKYPELYGHPKVGTHGN